MKRTMIVAVIGLLVMSSVAEARCCNRIGCGGGGFGHRRQRTCSACGGHAGLFHRCKQQTMVCQATVAYQPPVGYQQPMAVYSTVATPPVTYAMPQVPSKSTPQMIPPPTAPPKSTPQMIPPPTVPPQPPGKSTPQR
jgi:hypothetical protein